MIHHINDKGENIIIFPLSSYAFDIVELFQRQFEKLTKKIIKTIFHVSAILSYTAITDNDDPIEQKRYHIVVIFFPLIYG